MKRKEERKKKVTKVKKNIGTQLITNTKKLKLKIQSRVWYFKNTMLKKRRKKTTKNQGLKIIKNIYMKFAFLKKKGLFFFFYKVIVGYKSEN